MSTILRTNDPDSGASTNDGVSRWAPGTPSTAGLVLIPAAGTVLATLARFAIQPLVGPQFPFFTYYLSVLISSWYGGARAAIVAFVLGYLTGSYLFVTPHGSFLPHTGPAWVGTIFISVTSLVTIVLFEQQRRLQRELHLRGVRTEAALAAEQEAHETKRRHLVEIESLNERLRRAMRETHHRVKNNLQVISAMVDLRMMDSEGSVPVAELERLNLHVKGLALIHEVLTRESNTSGQDHMLSARAAIERLLDMLKRTYPQASITGSIEHIEVSQRHASSLAILVNELVSNAVKHGGASVTVLLISNNVEAQLEVQDDGPGFPAGFDSQRDAHTGLELVSNVARWDLNGTVAFENRSPHGARVAVTFPLPAPEQQAAALPTTP